MATIITIREAEDDLLRLLDRAHAGEEIVLSKAGKPYARIVPPTPESGRSPGQLPGLVVGPEFFEPLPEEEINAWEGM